MNSKEDERKMNYLKPDPKPKVMSVQLRWIILFSKSSWIKTTVFLSFELGVNGEKKVNGNWDINKNGHSTFNW